jgi:type I restriction enzyme M protein
MFDIAPATATNGDVLKARVKQVHNFIYANDSIKQHSRVFDEVAKVMLAKLEWERTKSDTPFAPLASEDAEVAGLGKASTFYRRIDDLYRAAAGGSEAEPLQLSPHVLASVARAFAGMPLLNTDAKGSAFQAIVGPQMRAEKGQFFTPNPAKRLLAAVLEPKEREVVLDPACGSGGLLAPFPKARLVGVEVDAALARVSRLGLLLHADAEADIVRADALAPRAELDVSLPPWARVGSVDVVLTNPPFGSKARVTDPRVLSGLPNLGGRRAGQVPEILFMERIIQWLRPGGRAGVVVPLGILANSSTQYVRDYLESEAEIVATISLPPETFRPADNGVQAGLLFLRKRGGDRPSASGIFMAIVRAVGYDHRERPILDNGPNGPVVREDVSAVIAAWRAANEEHQWF